MVAKQTANDVSALDSIDETKSQQEFIDEEALGMPLAIVDDDRTMEELLPNADNDTTRRNRKDPLRVLRKLTDRPEVLMRILLATDAGIAGKGIVEYFFPERYTGRTRPPGGEPSGPCKQRGTVKTWDWVFIVNDDLYTVTLFLRAMYDLGFNFSDSSSDNEYNVGTSKLVYRFTTGHVQYGDLSIEVGLIVMPSASATKMLPGVSSVVSGCMITGSTAICLDYGYYEAVMQTDGIHRTLSGRSSAPHQCGGWFDLECPYYQNVGTVRRMGGLQASRVRHALDSSCYTQDLSYIYTDSVTLEQIAEHRTRMLSSMTWIENCMERLPLDLHQLDGRTHQRGTEKVEHYAEYMFGQYLMEYGLLPMSRRCKLKAVQPFAFCAERMFEQLPRDEAQGLVLDTVENTFHGAMLLKALSMISNRRLDSKLLEDSASRALRSVTKLPWHVEDRDVLAEEHRHKDIHEFGWWCGVHVANGKIHCVTSRPKGTSPLHIVDRVHYYYTKEFGRSPDCPYIHY